ncbi:hypothetical protein JW613_29230 [Streptomyces smyrnaeus]|uniref:Tetracyclin repressor-like C-terminal domain-containing protein n=1 Tax=Streptomyces smyrnaeus TaxID=1387713 RepID=A0ABS3Y3W7_9ACTN|nr:hypothetical protein [Streptomyces smyrnaeus]MBO8202338.1 hypothetical protein [Streptomyces smyrnaeus]
MPALEPHPRSVAAIRQEESDRLYAALYEAVPYGLRTEIVRPLSGGAGRRRVLGELPAAAAVLLRKAPVIDHESAFEVGLALILDGLVHRTAPRCGRFDDPGASIPVRSGPSARPARQHRGNI